MPMTFHGPSDSDFGGPTQAGTVERPIAAGRAALRDSRVHSKTRRKSRWNEGGRERKRGASMVTWSVGQSAHPSLFPLYPPPSLCSLSPSLPSFI